MSARPCLNGGWCHGALVPSKLINHYIKTRIKKRTYVRQSFETSFRLLYAASIFCVSTNSQYLTNVDGSVENKKIKEAMVRTLHL